MMNKIKSLILKYQKSNKLRIALYWSIVIFMFLYIFSIPAVSGRDRLYIISYFIMAVFIGVTAVYVIIFARDKIKFNFMLCVPVAFVFFAFVGTLLFSRDFRGWFTLVLMSISLVISYFSYIVINNKRLIIKIIIFALLAFVFYLVFVYRKDLLHIGSVNLKYLRIGTYFDNVNTIGFYLAIGACLSLYVAIIFRKKIELLYLIPAAIFAGLGFLTSSRAFTVVAILGAAVVLIMALRKRILLLLISFAVLVGVFIIVINLPTLSFLKDQFERMFFSLFGVGDSKADASTLQRVVWIQYAWNLGSKNPLIGYGCSGFSIFSGVGTYSHNNFAEVICNFGIIGFVLYYLSFIIPMFRLSNIRDKETHIAILIVVLYLVRGFFGVTYYSKDSYLMIAFVVYLVHDCRFFSPSLKKSTHSNVGNYEVCI